MDLDDVCDLFAERPFRMTSEHRAIITRLIAIARAAADWADDETHENTEHLRDKIEDLADY